MLGLGRDKSRIRAPAVAGLFYPAEASELRQAVDAHLMTDGPPVAASHALSVPTHRAPKALIVPHAGYVYSGDVAGFAYRSLLPASAALRHVVLLGPSHRVPVQGLAVPSVDGFATPLGDVPIDVATRDRLCAQGLAETSDAAHRFEHSLEVQLPFLQQVLGHAFDLLPIAVGFATSEQVRDVIEATWGGADTLVVVSSDLSHYHEWHEAKRIDAETIAGILDRRSDLDDEQACGARGINGLMQLARKRGLRVDLLDQRNSGDVSGDRSRVVGYASFAVHDA